MALQVKANLNQAFKKIGCSEILHTAVTMTQSDRRIRGVEHIEIYGLVAPFGIDGAQRSYVNHLIQAAHKVDCLSKFRLAL
jgi:hypothetical protein